MREIKDISQSLHRRYSDTNVSEYYKCRICNFSWCRHYHAEYCANVENAKKAVDMGVDMIVLTGNPGVGVDKSAITKALTDLKEAVGDRVILTAGKMHASGILSESGEKILTKEDAEAFIEAGADIHHIGDSGYMGMALPENITAYSVAIRGKRHTYRRMAMSLVR